jgi:hypothetical protein
MLKDWLIFKLKDQVVPEIMEEFKQIQIPGFDYKKDHYEIKAYDLETDITPLTGDQIDIVTDEAQNTLSVSVKGFKMEFHGRSYARLFFIHAHGYVDIEATIDEVKFTVAPKLRADGTKNAIDYDIKDIKLREYNLCKPQ